MSHNKLGLCSTLVKAPRKEKRRKSRERDPTTETKEFKNSPIHSKMCVILE
jgi:hypothetical protein